MHRDRAAENVAEEQDKDHRLDHGKDQTGRHSHPDQEVTPGNDQRVDDRPAGPDAQAGRARLLSDRGHDAVIAAPRWYDEGARA